MRLVGVLVGLAFMALGLIVLYEGVQLAATYSERVMVLALTVFSMMLGGFVLLKALPFGDQFLDWFDAE